VKLTPNQACPCSSGRKYKRCCRLLHSGDAATSAEALMRSRYAAYAGGLVDYVMRTTDPDGPLARPDRDVWEAENHAFCRDTEFPGLEIIDVQAGPEESTVRFRAQLRQDGEDASFVENSRFLLLDGCWLYHSGEIEEELPGAPGPE
jgi:SEC-C motif-containing protein